MTEFLDGASDFLHRVFNFASLQNTVGAHLFRLRFDVLITVIVPLVLMIESGWGNSWAFSGGHLLGITDANTWMSLIRGFALEALVFATFKMTRFLVLGGWKRAVMAPFPFLIGLMAIVVSAGCNVGYINNGGELGFVVRSTAQYLPPFMTTVFKVGIGLLFPVGVGVFALFDMQHFINEVFESLHLDETADRLAHAALWRKMVAAESRKAIKASQPQLAAICAVDAQNMVAAVKRGDYSFGAGDIKQKNQAASLPVGRTQITPGASQQALPSGRSAQPQLTLPAQSQVPPSRPGYQPVPPAYPPAAAQTQSFITAQVSQPPVTPTGATQNLPFPPVSGLRP